MNKLNIFLVIVLSLVLIPTVSSAHEAGNQLGEMPMVSSMNNSQAEKMDSQEKDNEERDKSEMDKVNSQDMMGQEDMMDKQENDKKDSQEKEGEDLSSKKDNEMESENEKEVSKRSEERSNDVKTAVQELVKTTSKIKGIGEQVKVIAQEQNKVQEEAENAVKEVAQRGKFLRFIVGPNYQKIKEAENKTEIYAEKIKEIKKIGENVTAASVSAAIDAQIQVLEKVKASLDTEIQNQKAGFSLFGWLNRLFAK